MIDVVKLINTFEDLIYHFIDSDMYCICYDDGKDKRLMINYGLFLTEEDCLKYIDSIIPQSPLKTPNSSIGSYPEVVILNHCLS